MAPHLRTLIATHAAYGLVAVLLVVLLRRLRRSLESTATALRAMIAQVDP
jgi:hypothetical protein